MQIPVSNIAGEHVSQLEISDYLFNIPMNEPVMHQALVRQLNDARVGTADTKTRGEVAGSTRKLYPQKHTGRARRGSKKSPLLRGGGIVFGPHPRSYKQKINRKMKSLAIRSALSSKVKENKLLVLDDLNLDISKTKEMAGILKKLGLTSSVLLVATHITDKLLLASRNLPKVKVLALDSLNLADLLSFQHLVMTVEVVKKAEALWGVKKVSSEEAGN